MLIILVKLTLYLTGKCRYKNKLTVSFLGKTPVKVKKYLKNQIISIPYLLQAQPALVQQLCADGMATNHSDS